LQKTKLQSYYILKFSSAYLKKHNFQINIDLSKARKNNLLVSLGDSQLLRFIRKIKNQEIDTEDINDLFKERKLLKLKSDSTKNRSRLIEIGEVVDSNLFVPELVSIVFSDNRHYQKIMEQGGFTVNGRKMTHLLASAGMIRKNTVLFVDDSIKKSLLQMLNVDRNEDVKLVPAKFGSYLSLASSATHRLSNVNFCVVPDCEINRLHKIDFVTEVENGDDIVEERDEQIPFNLWDGMGLISYEQSALWSMELGISHIPSTWCVRNAFTKGMLVTFPFHEFATKIAKQFIIKDVWGNDVDIRNVEVLVSASMFKLWSSFESQLDYEEKCKKYDWGWGVSRYNPETDKDHTTSNYQFIQALNLNDEQIESLCSETLKFFENTIGKDVRYTLLYLLGELSNNEDISEKWYYSTDDVIVKALILNNKLIDDPYIQKRIEYSLNKKIRETYIGSIFINGNYQAMVSDPYGMCEHIFGMEVKGLLKDSEYYSSYWNKKSIDKVSACRSPLTHYTENNILNLKNREELNYWYRYIKSGIIYNIHGTDTLTHGGSDWDFDICMTTSNQEFIDGAQPGLPITCNKKSASKVKITEDEVYLADLKGFGTKVGFLTNLSTSFYALLPMFEKGTKEYETLFTRLKLARIQQERIIDSAKGIIVKNIPEFWSKWKKIKPDMSEDESEQIRINNKIIADKRPYFMKWLYPEYMRKFRRFEETYENISMSKFHLTMRQLQDKNDKNEKEQTVVKNYFRYHPFILSDCLMNCVCRYMESKVREIRLCVGKDDFDCSVLMDSDVEISEDKLSKMLKIFEQYKYGKKTKIGLEKYENFGQFVKEMQKKAYKEVSSNAVELANLSVHINYKMFPKSNKDFCWHVFGEDILKNVYKNRQENVLVPAACETGDIEYLGKRYMMTNAEINY
jgi:hypothetical protein